MTYPPGGRLPFPLYYHFNLLQKAIWGFFTIIFVARGAPVAKKMIVKKVLDAQLAKNLCYHFFIGQLAGSISYDSNVIFNAGELEHRLLSKGTDMGTLTIRTQPEHEEELQKVAAHLGTKTSSQTLLKTLMQHQQLNDEIKQLRAALYRTQQERDDYSGIIERFRAAQSALFDFKNH